MGKHSILVIKKENKYLQYYDNDWKSYLFLNCKIENKDSIETIKNYLKTQLNLNNFDIQYVGVKKHSKFSEKHQKMKEYEHYFYNIKLKEDFKYYDSDTFEVDGVIFKWFTHDELLNDERIKKVNSDIISFVKEFNL